MTHFYFPGWGWFVAIAALYLFYATNRSARVRRENRKEKLGERQAELLEMLRKKKQKEEANKQEGNENE
jgi:hypothetical protein